MVNPLLHQQADLKIIRQSASKIKIKTDRETFLIFRLLKICARSILYINNMLTLSDNTRSGQKHIQNMGEYEGEDFSR